MLEISPMFNWPKTHQKGMEVIFIPSPLIRIDASFIFYILFYFVHNLDSNNKVERRPRKEVNVRFARGGKS